MIKQGKKKGAANQEAYSFLFSDDHMSYRVLLDSIVHVRTDLDINKAMVV